MANWLRVESGTIDARERKAKQNKKSVALKGRRGTVAVSGGRMESHAASARPRTGAGG